MQLLLIGFASGIVLIIFVLLLEGARQREPFVDLMVALIVSTWLALALIFAWVIIGEQVLDALGEFLKPSEMLLALPVVLGVVLLIVLLVLVMLFEIRSRAILQILEEIQRQNKGPD